MALEPKWPVTRSNRAVYPKEVDKQMHKTSATRRSECLLSKTGGARVLPMERQKMPGSGRKSKGPREVYATRVAPELGRLLREEAERLDLAYSEVLANVLAAHYGLPPVTIPKNEAQMKLTA